MTIKHVLNMIDEHEIQFIDLRFTDPRGILQHVSIPAHVADEEFFKYGKMFDGSSIQGFRSIHESDMILMPDHDTPKLDPFAHHPTLILTCDVYDPSTNQPYGRDPRSVARRAEAYLKSTGLADTIYCGPEPEFFIFDSVRWENSMHHTMYAIDSLEASCSSNRVFEEGNMGHRPSIKGGYFPVPPVDSFQDIRSAICLTLEELGMVVETHHHEVGGAGQNEISVKFNTLLNKADEFQLFKYVVHNTAHQFGKTATFMPKPLVGDNGSGMHVHQSLSKDGVNLFAGDDYAKLSETALFYIGGIIKHAKTLNAFTNSTTNSYRRLVPGFEAPVMLAYSAVNRSAAIRIPFAPTPKGRRIEIRFPDALSNPYLAFSAMMMAGLDGIKNKIHPGKALDIDLYELTKEQAREIPQVSFSLFHALDELDKNREFLLQGDVFSDDLIDSYIELKYKEAMEINMMVHPMEFEKYYSS
ncbi:MAG: type I glutamate--ammonia ligase [Legionellales bacterium]|nr:type I glutamate--ammonia ligase [Legionellales bacterium]